MDTFVVRIYRRSSHSMDEVVGTVECVGCGERQGFAGRDELWDRLALGAAHAHENAPPDGETGRERPSALVATRDPQHEEYGESHRE